MPSDDQLIGYKARDEVSSDGDIYRSSCIWIETSSGQVLLAQRKWTKDKDPGLWGTAYESNTYKELEEEIGLTDIKLDAVAKIWEGEPRKHFIQVFVGRVDRLLDNFELQEEEVEQVMWVNKADLVKDHQLDPGKYVPSMSQLIKLLLTQH